VRFFFLFCFVGISSLSASGYLYITVHKVLSEILLIDLDDSSDTFRFVIVK
jgi:hypothetical protein